VQYRGAQDQTFTADYVTTEDGTGIVHTAPGFGEEDYAAMKDTGVPIVCPIDAECKFTDEVPEYRGLFVKDADEAIIKRLKEEGKLVRGKITRHSYPFLATGNKKTGWIITRGL